MRRRKPAQKVNRGIASTLLVRMGNEGDFSAAWATTPMIGKASGKRMQTVSERCAESNAGLSTARCSGLRQGESQWKRGQTYSRTLLW